jgi:hypothetical protein
MKPRIPILTSVILIMIALSSILFLNGSISGNIVKEVDPLTQSISAPEPEYHNSTLAAKWIKDTENEITELEQNGLGVIRMNDILKDTKQLYEAQVALEKQNGIPDFRLIKQRIDEIEQVKVGALEVGDQLTALRVYVDSIKNLNLSEVNLIYDQAKAEFSKERYDVSSNLIESAYKKISQIQAASTTTSVIYKVATASVMSFLKENWKTIVIIISVLFILGIILHNRIFAYIITRKILKLQLEKSILNNLIQQTQKEYFDKKTLPEESFNIRIKKFKELIREINRQIPLLKEQVERRKRTKSLPKKKI